MPHRLPTLIRDLARAEILPRFLHVRKQRKADGSLFTEADTATQAALAAALPAIADVPFLGEEMSEAEHRALWQAHSGSGLWVVDPIDGTTNFVNGIPHFAVSVALVQGGKTAVAAIYNPMSEELFFATRGGGAFLNDTALPIKAHRNRLNEAVAACEAKYLRSGRLVSRLYSIPPYASQRNLGACTLDWCYTAAGRFDVYVHGGQKPWDYAAGALILEEAGGGLATLEGDEFWSGQHVFHRSVIAATHNELFNEWLAWIRANQ